MVGAFLITGNKNMVLFHRLLSVVSLVLMAWAIHDAELARLHGDLARLIEAEAGAITGLIGAYGNMILAEITARKEAN